ncbi:MAG: hypothetical protein ACYCW6_11130 [Candidatus Xenobia bacterium]
MERKRLFWALLVLLEVSAFYCVVAGYRWWMDRENGPGLWKRAWVACFTERGLSVPVGPREGWHAEHLGHPQFVYDKDLRYRQAASHVPGLVDIDVQGMQHWHPTSAARHRVLVLGGSVGWGACASDEAHTWWAQMGQRLEGQGWPCDITVMAAGAWKSAQELGALRRCGPGEAPDVVMFVDGLNDLTQGARAHTLNGQWVKTRDGSVWDNSYHERDFPERAAYYLENMQAAHTISRTLRARLVIVLQPLLLDKHPASKIEQRLHQTTASQYHDAAAVLAAYQTMREGLQRLAAEDSDVLFVDASRAFDGEPTTFMDLWHFADPGHTLLARLIGDRLLRWDP